MKPLIKIVLADVDGSLTERELLFASVLSTFNDKSLEIIKDSFTGERFKEFASEALEWVNAQGKSLVEAGDITTKELKQNFFLPIAAEDSFEATLKRAFTAANRLAHSQSNNRQDPELLFRNSVIRLWAKGQLDEEVSKADVNSYILKQFFPALKAATEAYVSGVKLMPGVKEAIEILAEKKVKMVLVTNSSESPTRYVYTEIARQVPRFREICQEIQCQADVWGGFFGKGKEDLSARVHAMRFPGVDKQDTTVKIEYVPAKPAPPAVDAILVEYGIRYDQAVFIGDKELGDGVTGFKTYFVHLKYDKKPEPYEAAAIIFKENYLSTPIRSPDKQRQKLGEAYVRHGIADSSADVSSYKEILEKFSFAATPAKPKKPSMPAQSTRVNWRGITKTKH